MSKYSVILRSGFSEVGGGGVHLNIISLKSEPWRGAEEEKPRGARAVDPVIRQSFGQSVRTWADDEAEPKPIIAKIFRDRGESNDGLTEAVEDAFAALWMAQRTREEGEIVQNWPEIDFAAYGREGGNQAVKERPLCRAILGVLHQRVASRAEIVASIGGEGGHYSRALRYCTDQGWTEFVPRGSCYCLTGAGHRQLREWQEREA